MTQNFAPAQVCVDCNGKCCQEYAGILTPDDVDQSIDISHGIKTLLRSGQYVVDWWEPDGIMNLTYFLRPAHTNAIGELKDASWGGVCVFFEDGFGCTLDFDRRPAQCRALEPGKTPGNCKTHLSKQEAAKLWIPYQDEIASSVRCLEEVTRG